MNKLDSLRTALATALPELADNPDRLLVFADKGQLAATAASGSSWEYRYTASLVLTDFAGDVDQVMRTALVWVATHQPDLLANAATTGSVVRFEAEILDNSQIDLSLALDLSEPVTASADGSTFTRPPTITGDPTAAWQWPTT